MKGAAPSGIQKKKTKSKKSVPSKETATTAIAAAATKSASSAGSQSPTTKDEHSDADKTREEIAQLERLIKGEEEQEERGYKTPAQIRQEEIRRKRLEEKFEKESREGGVKTHKQRVEDLNRYLSGLSEHHDMPKIGPG